VRFIERGEFAQGFDQNGEPAHVTFTLRRLLPGALEALFNVAHLPVCRAPQALHQSSPRL
jgi:hypothetical protein